jgi:hypothetical protein
MIIVTTAAVAQPMNAFLLLDCSSTGLLISGISQITGTRNMSLISDS